VVSAAAGLVHSRRCTWLPGWPPAARILPHSHVRAKHCRQGVIAAVMEQPGREVAAAALAVEHHHIAPHQPVQLTPSHALTRHLLLLLWRLLPTHTLLLLLHASLLLLLVVL